jgi:hypothetical protein
MFRRRKQHESPISDAETADAMSSLAEAFITGMADEGEQFTWDQTEVSRLDDLCSEFVLTNPPEDVRGSWIMGMGAYLGELLVRHADGRWIYDAERREAAVELAKRYVVWPHSKVAKRLLIGPEHNLSQYYWLASTGEAPPGSVVREWRD